MSHPQMPLMTKHIGDNLTRQKEKRAKIQVSLSIYYLIRRETKSMARRIASVFILLFFSLIIQRAGGSSCEADLGQDHSDQTDFKVDNDGGGEWKESLKDMKAKVDQAVAGVNREVG